MDYLKTYLNTITARGNEDLAKSVLKTADDVGNTYIKKFSFTEHQIGLLFGNVQSGKTAQMFGIMCKAANLGFPAFVLLTTDNVVLQQQTLERVQSDLDGFCICGENDSKIFMENRLLKPVIVVLKKNGNMLKLWANIFNNTQFMKGNPLFIVDDEADAASLNTKVNQKKQSSINKYLDVIKNGASSSLYLQVTGTPQALLLQSMASGWHPYFTYYFEPGKAYLGGDFFFAESNVGKVVIFIDNLKEPIIDMLIHHLAVTAVLYINGKNCSNCLVHPGVRTASHDVLAIEVKTALKWCADNLQGAFKDKFMAEYQMLNPVKYEKPAPELALKKATELVKQNDINIIVMNGKTEVSTTDYATGCNVVIGGNTLGRGVTFSALHTIYYTRTSKKPHADTIWQHSRMFGYDRDAGMTKLYIGSLLYKLFADINTVNNNLVGQIEKGIENIKIYYPKGINPTRKNVVDNSKVGTIVGGTNYYPYYPDNKEIEDIDRLMQVFDSNEPYYQVSLRLVLQVLDRITSEDDFRVDAFKEFIEAMLADNPTEQGILIVRRDRNIAQGTGAMLSPNDWDLGGQFKKQVVLTMYKVTGTKGWGGKQLWVPNIKLPDGVVYYDVKE